MDASAHCDRLAAELTVMHHMPHVTADDITQRIHDHTRWHRCDDPYTVPPGLARDPRDDPRTTQEDQ